MLKRAGRAPFVQRMIGNALAGYLQMVRSTSTFVLDPPDFFDAIRPDLPVICAMWHGQHFVMPFARPPSYDVRVMISRSADGEINAIAASKLGLGLIRASGAHHAHQVSKRGGLRGFIEACGKVSINIGFYNLRIRQRFRNTITYLTRSNCP